MRAVRAREDEGGGGSGELGGGCGAGSGRWMQGISSLTDKANGNKWLPCQLTNGHTGLGIEPITADKHWHDMRFVCFPLTRPTFLFFTFPKQYWNTRTCSFMHYACTLTVMCMTPACVAVNLCVHMHVYLCNIHSSVAVINGVLCCSTGAISQPESRGWPPGYDAPR